MWDFVSADTTISISQNGLATLVMKGSIITTTNADDFTVAWKPVANVPAAMTLKAGSYIKVTKV